jgi:methylglutaconyl-CoA hydratase
VTGELVHLEVGGGIATITLDSPDNRNALSRRLFADLQRQIEAALAEPSARIIVLTATGTVFCSGADLKEQRQANEAGATGAAQIGPGPLAEILTALWNSPKPVLGRINGHARAGGVGLVAACDIAVAVETATFAFSEVRIGVAPAIISVVSLPKLGLATATELMLTGEPFTAGAAVQYGLITRAVPATEFDAAVADYARKLLLGAPEALAATKRLIREVPGLSMPEAFAQMAVLSADRFASAEALEGMTAFADKRPPRWAG